MMKWYALGLLLVMGSASLQCFAGLEEGNNAYYREDYETALKEFMPLAEQGNAKAQSKLGKMYYNGQGVKKDYANALDWYKKSALGGDQMLRLKFLSCIVRGITTLYWRTFYLLLNKATCKLNL